MNPSEPSSASPGPGDRARAQEERAIRTIDAIFSGADLVDETLRLSNEFTDRQTARVAGLIRRRKSAD